MAMVDWDAAEDIGVRLVPAGPKVSGAEADEAVADLQSAAVASVDPVREETGLFADTDTHRAVVVDRNEWIRSNVAGMRELLAPLEARISDGQGPNWVTGGAGRVAAFELGAALSLVATKVLGQYEAVVPSGQRNRLLLVAPNIVTVERELDVVPQDFRMWVALHEETHRVQFGAVPWLEGHFRSEVEVFLSEVETSNTQALKRLGAIVSAIIRVLRGAPGATIIDAVQTPRQREIFLRLTALMSLLEGHADYVMDSVGPEIVPSLPQIRSRFDVRRSNPGARDGLMRRLLGMDAKLKQYTDGRKFVAHAVDAIGMQGFNQVWQSPDSLPTAVEIEQPALWVNRFSG